ncbi:hypothetical protein F5Y11DRAFT_163535 [Daldinia sp. FL1419]|nr:hypothetical protein F5Y11DRAFT_163535 [Daldinia sp. FL1419]
MDATYSYHNFSRSRQIIPTPTQIERVLVPRQTIHERNLSSRTCLGRYAPVWLRTCYLPELADTYTNWCKGDLEHLLGHWSQVLNDEALYSSCGDDWSRILLRIPAIADTIEYIFDNDGIIQEDEEDFEPPPGPGEEFKMTLYEAGRKEKTMLFLIDEEALRSGFLKIFWLDIHGNCVWENRLRPNNMLEFRGRMFDGGCLADLYDNCDYVDMYEPGALLEID